MKKILMITLILGSIFMLGGCTQETQNKIGRSIQNWTGTNGTLDIYMGDSGEVTQRFLKIDKLTTATSTNGDTSRNYRYAYGILDSNLNGKVDEGEKKIYFEISNYSTPYVFYENPSK